jgi:hypothetical protein
MATLAHLGSGGKSFINKEVLRELDKQGFSKSLQKK